MYLHIVYEVKSPAKETAADPTLTNLDYSQAEMAVAARRDPCSCTHVPQMGHNAADGVRFGLPERVKVARIGIYCRPIPKMDPLEVTFFARINLFPGHPLRQWQSG